MIAEQTIEPSTIIPVPPAVEWWHITEQWYDTCIHMNCDTNYNRLAVALRLADNDQREVYDYICIAIHMRQQLAESTNADLQMQRGALEARGVFIASTMKGDYIAWQAALSDTVVIERPYLSDLVAVCEGWLGD